MPPATANPTTSADALSQLQQYQGSLQTPQQALDAAKGTLGVNGAQATATGLQGAIQNTTNLLGRVAPSVYGRTQQSLVTDAGASRQIANESAPLQSQLEKEGTDYTNANDTYKTLLGEAQSQADSTLGEQQNRQNYLQTIYNDLYGKETDAAKLAEQSREADLSAKASSSSGLSGALGSLLGSGASASNPADAVKSQAATAVNNLLKTKNNQTIAQTVQAISKSAGYGNAYDQAKLELLRSAVPGYFNKDGTLNTSRINYLQSDNYNDFVL